VRVRLTPFTDLRAMDIRASAFVFCAFTCCALTRAQQAPTDSTQYWQKDREWKVRNFGHAIGVEVGWYEAHDLATMQLFPRNGSVVDVSKDYERIYFLSASISLHTQQDVSWSRIDNGTLGGHQWRFSLDRFPGRTSGMIAETDSIAGDSVYTMSTAYFYAQNEAGLTVERRWRSNERRPFYFGGGLALGLGTTTNSQFYVYEATRLRDVSGTKLVTSTEEYYPGKRCTYFRASLTGRAGVRILKRVDVAWEASYGMGLQMIHGSDVRVINQRVAVCFSTRYTIKR
jgi:hypothetical protein